VTVSAKPTSSLNSEGASSPLHPCSAFGHERATLFFWPDRASKVGSMSRVEECPMPNLPAILSADKSG
jgi:hypothetical protein